MAPKLVMALLFCSTFLVAHAKRELLTKIGTVGIPPCRWIGYGPSAPRCEKNPDFTFEIGKVLNAKGGSRYARSDSLSYTYEAFCAAHTNDTENCNKDVANRCYIDARTKSCTSAWPLGLYQAGTCPDTLANHYLGCAMKSKNECPSGGNFGCVWNREIYLATLELEGIPRAEVEATKAGLNFGACYPKYVTRDLLNPNGTYNNNSIGVAGWERKTHKPDPFDNAAWSASYGNCPWAVATQKVQQYKAKCDAANGEKMPWGSARGIKLDSNLAMTACVMTGCVIIPIDASKEVPAGQMTYYMKCVPSAASEAFLKYSPAKDRALMDQDALCNRLTLQWDQASCTAARLRV